MLLKLSQRDAISAARRRVGAAQHDEEDVEEEEDDELDLHLPPTPIVVHADVAASILLDLANTNSNS
jgi:hypothetical protein